MKKYSGFLILVFFLFFGSFRNGFSGLMFSGVNLNEAPVLEAPTLTFTATPTATTKGRMGLTAAVPNTPTFTPVVYYTQIPNPNYKSESSRNFFQNFNGGVGISNVNTSTSVKYTVSGEVVPVGIQLGSHVVSRETISPDGEPLTQIVKYYPEDFDFFILSGLNVNSSGANPLQQNIVDSISSLDPSLATLRMPVTIRADRPSPTGDPSFSGGFGLDSRFIPIPGDSSILGGGLVEMLFLTSAVHFNGYYDPAQPQVNNTSLYIQGSFFASLATQNIANVAFTNTALPYDYGWEGTLGLRTTSTESTDFTLNVSQAYNVNGATLNIALKYEPSSLPPSPTPTAILAASGN